MQLNWLWLPCGKCSNEMAECTGRTYECEALASVLLVETYHKQSRVQQTGNTSWTASLADKQRATLATPGLRSPGLLTWCKQQGEQELQAALPGDIGGRIKESEVKVRVKSHRQSDLHFIVVVHHIL